MKVEISGNTIRVIGNKGVDVIMHLIEGGYDRFSFSLAYRGFEHGYLPSVEAHNENTIVVINNLEKGRNLLT